MSPGPAAPIRVLIADDSALVRELLKDMIADEPGFALAGEARDGREAVEKTQALSPDIVTMDVLMPVMDGLEAVEQIMAFHPTPILVFSSAISNQEMNIAFAAISRGALDVMEKPAKAGSTRYEEIRREFLSKLRLLSRIPVIPHLRGRHKRPSAPVEPAAPPRVPTKPAREPAPALIPPPLRRQIVAIGASTGGPKALVQIFRDLPGDLPVPVLLVQHIAPSFAEGLADWLNRESKVRVKLAAEGERINRGVAYIAPTGRHLQVNSNLLHLADTPPVNSCRPSVDVLFHSVATGYGERALAVLLTGMGRDGADGMKAIHDLRGHTLVQDEASSVIFGMPRAAIELNAVDEVHPLSEIANAIVQGLGK